jgi:POT family proton-dependent oligopeptide transporter
MWERFSFYTMAALFMFYMTWDGNGQPFLQAHASLVNGAYFGTVYFTPFFGGILTDRLLGSRNAVLLGGLVMALGHVLLAFDQLGFFFAGLAALAVGNGFFKPNISTLVGNLYPPGDARLDSAYTIFYMGINAGGFLAPLVAGWLRVRYGYHVAFASAGVGMVVSLLIFLAGQAWLKFTGPLQSLPEEEVSPAIQRERHLALLVLFVVVILFWMAFQQGGNTLQLWFRDSTDRTPPFGMNWGALLDKEGVLNEQLINSINPFYVIVLGLPLAWLWQRLGSTHRQPSTPVKMGIGMLLTSVGFLVFGAGALAGADTPGVRVSVLYLLAAYLLITLGELSLSPLGMSLVRQLAAPRSRTAWMGGWFAAIAVGSYLSGVLGAFWTVWPHSAFFAVLACATLAAFGILAAFLPWLRRVLPTPGPAPKPNSSSHDNAIQPPP